MSGPGPRWPVNGPIPTPPLLSLWTMAQRPEAAELVDARGIPRWGNGVAFTPSSCGGDVATMDMGCAEGGAYQADTKPTKSLVSDINVDPFQIVGPETCSPFSNRDVGEYKARARQLLEACWVKHMEYEFWTGTKVPGNPRLADGANVDDLTPGGAGGTAMTLRDAMAQIEEGLTDCGCGGQGMIHMSRRAFSHFADSDLVIIPNNNPAGGVAMTKLGTLVVPGSGYTGSNPAGTFTADTEYIYGTGMVKVFRGEAFVIPDPLEEALNRSNNQITYYAERAALVLMDDCCLVGLKVDVEGGGAS